MKPDAKSGSNAVRGTVSSSSGEALNARNFFASTNPEAAVPSQSVRRGRQGPIEESDVFFADFRERQAIGRTVIPRCRRRCSGREITKPSGRGVRPIFDPATTVVSGTTVTRTVHGERDSRGRIDPVARTIPIDIADDEAGTANTIGARKRIGRSGPFSARVVIDFPGS